MGYMRYISKNDKHDDDDRNGYIYNIYIYAQQYFRYKIFY